MFKRKANSYKKCFNYHKLDYFKRDCPQPNKRFQRLNLNSYLSNNNKSTQPQYGLNRANRSNSLRNNSWPHPQTIENKEDNFNTKLFMPGQLGTAFIIKELQKSITITWFLDSYAFWYTCNDWHLFSNMWAKNINFRIAVGQIIQNKEIGTVFISLNNDTSIKLSNVVLVPDCNSNLILLS